MIAIAPLGMRLALNGCELHTVPAHFLRPVGNFHVDNPICNILFSGGACRLWVGMAFTGRLESR